MMKKFSSLLLFLALLPASAIYGQSIDFEEFPELVANYSHLQLELQVTDGPEIRGDAVYQLTLLRDDIDSLKLDAVRMDIELVEWDGEPLEYRMRDNEMIVLLPGDAEEGADHTLRIQYRANPSFGVFEDHNGNIWSSGLPGTVRHWLPGMDHPRNSLTTDIAMIFPGGINAVITGVPGEASAESVDLQRLRFHTESDIPLSSLRFAIGNFDRTQTTVGRHQIYLHSERGLLSDEQKANLLDDAFIAFRHAERTLGTSYPSRVLHLVVLDDDNWETKNYGAGVVFGFKGLQNLPDQIAFGVTGQWLGVQLREEQWADASALMLMQAWLHSQSDELKALKQKRTVRPEFRFDGIYNQFSIEQRIAWNTFIEKSEAEKFRRVLHVTAPDLINDLPEVINWYDFASVLYQKTGWNLMEIPAPEMPEREEEVSVPVYRVVFDHDEAESRVRLRFSAENESVDELVTVIAEEFTRNDKRSREITFTGSSDEVVLNVNRAIENLKLTVEEDDRVKLKPEKPFMFWVYQLQHDEDPESRADAARNLTRFADNPDLQLALLDIIDVEDNPGVYAEAIRTLAAVTNGASGTDQLFRQRFSTDRDPEIQEAIVEALGNYQNNDTVISQLRNIILNPGSGEVQQQAIRSLARITDADRFQSFAESLLADERVEKQAPLMLRELARADETTAVVSLAANFIEDNYPYRSRVQVLDLLLDYDRSAERWERRITRLSTDSDPRIRLRILDGLQFLSSGTRNEIIEERLYEEYDDRILRRLRQLSES